MCVVTFAPAAASAPMEYFACRRTAANRERDCRSTAYDEALLKSARSIVCANERCCASFSNRFASYTVAATPVNCIQLVCTDQDCLCDVRELFRAVARNSLNHRGCDNIRVGAIVCLYITSYTTPLRRSFLIVRKSKFIRLACMYTITDGELYILPHRRRWRSGNAIVQEMRLRLLPSHIPAAARLGFFRAPTALSALATSVAAAETEAVVGGALAA
ncbi:unnamed protein product [Trichogramma brassicae]|uniref:Uncharacterized protein n=1 Tax=Trichogramma brassicae TaxID=86971 RepID=A0A6H5I4D4_9HYME|nr:unnamed protein product [Trichogramma brassicae]